MLIYFYRNAERLSTELLDSLVALMPQQQQNIVLHYKTHRQRCEQALAYTMLCHALKKQQLRIRKTHANAVFRFRDELLTPRYIKRNAPIWAFGEHGKPYITNYEGIHFNISHCREAVAVGISDHEIGIDIEGRRRFSDTLIERAFSDEEKAILKDCDDPQKEFACIWTRKEAWFKYTGTGILMDHLKTTEADARDAGCIIHTSPVVATEEGDEVFWLSIAEKRRPIE